MANKAFGSHAFEEVEIRKLGYRPDGAQSKCNSHGLDVYNPKGLRTQIIGLWVPNTMTSMVLGA